MVNVFIVNSSLDGADAQNVKAYLEQADSSGHHYAQVRILDRPTIFWKREFKRLMKETHLVLLQGPNFQDSANIRWEMNYIFRQGKAVLIHQTDCNLSPPNCLKGHDPFTGKIILKAEVCSKEEVRERIERYDRKEYDIFSEAYKPLSSPDARADKEKLFEQYKLYQETAEAVVERRQTVNNLYILINGAFFTIIGTIMASESLNMEMKLAVALLMSIAGVLLNLAWRQIIRSYGLLNQHKLQVLNLIEKQLPLRLYAAEWEVMDDKMNPNKYRSFTSTERKTPKLFLWLYGVMAVACLCYFLYNFAPVVITSICNIFLGLWGK